MTLGIIVTTGIICLIIWQVSKARDNRLIEKYDDAHLNFNVDFPHPLYADQARVKEFISSEFRTEVLEKYLEICNQLKDPVPAWINNEINKRLNYLKEALE